MLDKMEYITINKNEEEITYPIVFTLNVMERIQDEYGSIDNWSSSLEPKTGEPQIKDIIWTFKEFINEGIEIENEDKNLNRQALTHKQVGRLITYVGGQKEVSNIISKAVVKSTSKKKNPNTKAKQIQEKQQ